MTETIPVLLIIPRTCDRYQYW